jgi:hypothetical protein
MLCTKQPQDHVLSILNPKNPQKCAGEVPFSSTDVNVVQLTMTQLHPLTDAQPVALSSTTPIEERSESVTQSSFNTQSQNLNLKFNNDVNPDLYLLSFAFHFI